MRFIHEQIRVKGAVTGVDNGKSAQAPPHDRTVRKHSQAILGYVQTNARTQVPESPQDLPLAQKNQKAENQNANRDQAECNPRIASAYASQGSKRDDFNKESKHSAAGAGKKDCAGHQYGREGDQSSLPPSLEMAQTDD